MPINSSLWKKVKMVVLLFILLLKIQSEVPCPVCDRPSPWTLCVSASFWNCQPWFTPTRLGFRKKEKTAGDESEFDGWRSPGNQSWKTMPAFYLQPALALVKGIFLCVWRKSMHLCHRCILFLSFKPFHSPTSFLLATENDGCSDIFQLRRFLSHLTVNCQPAQGLYSDIYNQ